MLTRARRMLSRLARLRRESESKLIGDAQRYWNDRGDSRLATNSHWRGNGPFDDDELWKKLGDSHVLLAQRACQWHEKSLSGSIVVEWGCGGGMNAVPFSRLVKHYYGVDISQDSLSECRRQVSQAGQSNFSGVHVTADAPESALERIPVQCDVFLCTYVYELLPTPEYGLRILDIASRLLKPGGTAVIQIRYNSGASNQRSLRHAYHKNAAQMTTYRVDEFWRECGARGFAPLFVTLLPEQPELRERRYAYFALQRASEAVANTS